MTGRIADSYDAPGWNVFGNLGFSETLLILAVALVLFGPRRLPEMARSIGRTLGQFRRAATEVRTTVEKEIRAEEVRSSLAEVTNVAGRIDREIAAAPTRTPAPRPPTDDGSGTSG